MKISITRAARLLDSSEGERLLGVRLLGAFGVRAPEIGGER
ncbi:MAG TPA: hypothetical protein VIJ84_09355 [Gaiellaceae bacterium]